MPSRSFLYRSSWCVESFSLLCNLSEQLFEFNDNFLPVEFLAEFLSSSFNFLRSKFAQLVEILFPSMQLEELFKRLLLLRFRVFEARNAILLWRMLDDLCEVLNCFFVSLPTMVLFFDGKGSVDFLKHEWNESVKEIYSTALWGRLNKLMEHLFFFFCQAYRNFRYFELTEVETREWKWSNHTIYPYVFQHVFYSFLVIFHSKNNAKYLHRKRFVPSHVRNIKFVK